MTRFYRYILATDNGMAPCIDNGLITLATCKPQIRRTAKAGDWVAGFYPSPHPRGLVSYVGRVNEVINIGAYEENYRGRSDAVYREKRDGTFIRLRPDYHPEPKQFFKDQSGPVLIFDKKATWYFGDKPKDLPDELFHLHAKGQGHRVNNASEQDIIALEKWLRTKWPPNVYGKPRNKISQNKSNQYRSKSRC